MNKLISLCRQIGKTHRQRILNVFLRLMPMAAKMMLAIYMGKYFNLADIGTYGLVIGSVTVLGVLMGQELIFVVSREIVGADPATVLHKMRDQVVLYGLNYLALAVVMFLVIVTHSVAIAPRTIVYTLVLTVLESLGSIGYFNLNSLNLQVRANALFFIRAGLWVFPVIALCILNPEFRTADTVLVGWIIGAVISLVIMLLLWRDLPWREVMARPINWLWIKQGVKVGTLVWLGTIGLTAGTFIDRFVVEHYLTREDVGVLTYFFSFTNALLTLTQSGVAAFATPRMVQHHKDDNHEEFHKVAKDASRQISIGAGGIAIGLVLFVPLLSYLLGRHAFIADTPVLLLMLFATWIRANADMKYNILFARHQDRAIWLGNLLFLIPALGGNLVLVPFFGLIGIGYSGILAAVFLYAWRWGHAKYYVHAHPL